MLEKQLDFILKGGLTKRYHTTDTLRPQNVAEHSFFVAWLMILMYGISSADDMFGALHHDIAEGSVGDISSPVKRAHPELKIILDICEDKAYSETDLATLVIDSVSKRRIKMADNMEGLLFCSREIRAGNRSIDMLEAYRNYVGYITALKPEDKELELLNIILGRT